MQRTMSIAMIVAAGVSLSGEVLSGCAEFPHRTGQSSAFSEGWRFLEVIGQERETSRVREVSARIAALEMADLNEQSMPERIALQVALMDALALLEWRTSRDLGADVPTNEWIYVQQHPHRETQRRKVAAALAAHPGDAYLVRAMISLRGFEPEFRREQLELAVARFPAEMLLREQLVRALLRDGEIEAARRHVATLLDDTSPRCDPDDSRVPLVLSVLGWLRAQPEQCQRLHASMQNAVKKVVGERSPVSGELLETLLDNRLRESPELVEPFLKSVSDLFATVACTAEADPGLVLRTRLVGPAHNKMVDRANSTDTPDPVSR